jgi:apolipoprotein D and lipocalin family protein
MKRIRGWCGVMALGWLAGCASPAAGPQLATVPFVDLNRYLGQWYEIATIPASFERGCTGVTAAYSLRPDGQIRVINTCHPERLDAPARQAEGRAWVVDKQTNAKLKVSFFLWFAGDYWVLELGPQYEYAVVGEPTREYLWVLCRQPTMDGGVYSAILARLQAQGYDVSKLKLTAQVH